MHNVDTLKTRVEKLRDDLRAAESELESAESLKKNDPITYLGKLIYANKVSGGSYGYDYGSFGETELKRAKEVLDTATGYLHIAEAFIVKFNIR